MIGFFKMRAAIHNMALSGSLMLAAPHCLLTAQETILPHPVNPQSSSTAAEPTQFTYIPMTGPDRLKHYLKSTVDPLAFVRSAAGAGIDQLDNQPKEWKQGAEGYGRRFGSSFGEHIVNTTIAFGASSILREDNRYFRSGESGFGARTGYALESTFLARRNDGTRRLSISRIIGFAGAALISRLWQPPSTNNLRDAGISFGTEIGVSAGFNVVREFLYKR